MTITAQLVISSDAAPFRLAVEPPVSSQNNPEGRTGVGATGMSNAPGPTPIGTHVPRVGNHVPRGYTHAEAVLYHADLARPGSALEVPLSAGERLEICQAIGRGRRSPSSAAFFVVEDGSGVSVSPSVFGPLSVKLWQAHSGLNAVPLAVKLPWEVALIIVARSGRLKLVRPDPVHLTVSVEADPEPSAVPIRPSRALRMLSYLASTSTRS